MEILKVIPSLWERRVNRLAPFDKKLKPMKNLFEYFQPTKTHVLLATEKSCKIRDYQSIYICNYTYDYVNFALGIIN